MAPAVSVSPNPIARPGTAGVGVAGVAPGTRLNVRVDGTTIATFRAGPSGQTGGIGIAIGATSAAGNHAVELRDSANKVTLASTELAVLASPPPTPAPPPTGTYKASGPISLTRADSGAPPFEWLDLSSTTTSGSAISIQGASASDRIRDITFRHCRVNGWNMAFLLRWAENVLLEDCEIPFTAYCGFNVFSSDHVRIVRPIVTKVLHDPLTHPQGNNAYGVKIDTYNANRTTDPVCDTVEVSDGVFRESLLWMNLNAHSGRHVSFLRNELHRTPRGVFVTSVDDLKVIGNQVLDPATTPGGSPDMESITWGGVTGGLIDQNVIGKGYPAPHASLDQYVGLSSGVVVGTNPTAVVA